RLEQLEQEVRQVPRAPTPTAAPPRPVAPAEPPPARRTVAAHPAERARVRTVLPVQPALDAARLEDWIRRHALGWVAVVLLLFATAFFLKYAFENQWIGEQGRVALGVAAGVALCLGGLVYHRKGWRLFSQMLTAGGVVLLYLAAYAA